MTVGSTFERSRSREQARSSNRSLSTFRISGDLSASRRDNSESLPTHFAPSSPSGLFFAGVTGSSLRSAPHSQCSFVVEPGSHQTPTKQNPPEGGTCFCRGDRIRTCDTRFWRPLLCQLSYTPKRLPNFTRGIAMRRRVILFLCVP